MQDPLAFIIAVSHIASAIALLNGFLVAIGQARIASAAIESMARQPEASDSIRGAMFISLGMAETGGIYGLLISFVMLFANPLVQIYLQNR
ncbi:MAG: ATP synthase F0 subunit C [Symbiobacteriaceae bacterium]|nr:ATP synthase F0 subunit C [Symbiobacteriaceae bacterium]